MEKYRKLTFISLSVLFGLLFLYIFLKYVLRILLPFILSLLIVCTLRPLINKICNKTRASKFFVTVFVLILSMLVIAVALIFASGAIIEQIGNIATSLMDSLTKDDGLINNFFLFIERLEEKIPFLGSATDESVYSIATGMITDGLKNLSLKITSIVARMIASIPNIMITIIVMLLSLFYFAKDYDKLGNGFIDILPKTIRDRAPRIKEDIISVISKYIKSYLILLMITFAELFSGFLVLNIENSFVLALIISLVDMLPILGVGTVLIPWSIIEIIGGNTRVAIGLLVMFIVIYLIRQYAEPKIISTQMDVHPLITLFAMYAGLKIAGIIGLIFAPLIAFVGKTILKSFKNQKTVDNQKQI